MVVASSIIIVRAAFFVFAFFLKPSFVHWVWEGQTGPHVSSLTVLCGAAFCQKILRSAIVVIVSTPYY